MTTTTEKATEAVAFSFAFFVYVVSTPVETLETMCETWRRHTTPRHWRPWRPWR